MGSKSFLRLLVFVLVVGCLAVLLLSQTRQAAQAGNIPAQTAQAAGSGSKPDSASRKVVAYYFLTTARCATCLKIEAYSQEAILTGFPQDIKKGRLDWQVINVEEIKNRHFIKDYQLITKSVVLVAFENGKQTEWTNLSRVWELAGNKDVFVKYIQDEMRTFLNK